MQNQILKEYKIFIDTCSLMHENCFVYLQSIKTKLQKNNNGIIIAKGVIDEIDKHTNSENNDTQERAHQARANIKFLQENNLGQIFGDKDDGFVDNLFQSLFIRYRQKYNLCLITQDVNLMKDINDLSKSRSVKSNKKIIVYKFSPISASNNDLIRKFFDTKKDHQLVKNSFIEEEINPFKASRKVVDIENFKPIQRSSIPEAGDIVISNKGVSLTLKDKIASGAEGDIFTFEITDKRAESDKYLCKIYKKNKINNAIIEKLKLMISKKIDIEGVCWPLSILYSSNQLENQPQTSLFNEVVGYVMKKATGHELMRSLFIEPLRIKKLGPDWSRKDLIRLSINILTTIDILHKHNIIIGDINPSNILVDKNANAYFIDTDSYQIEGYPCPVGSPSFTHPDILRKKFVTFLRKKEHEYFAISTLLFMILVPGKSPFSFQGGSSPAANVKKRNFVFPFHSREKNIHHHSHQIKKDGRWRYVWSHLPHKIKEAFYNSFVAGEMLKINGKGSWIQFLEFYLSDIDKQAVSNDLFPDDFKKLSEYAKKKFNIGD